MLCKNDFVLCLEQEPDLYAFPEEAFFSLNTNLNVLCIHIKERSVGTEYFKLFMFRTYTAGL